MSENNGKLQTAYPVPDEITGRIFDIQRYSIHDGPGIRTIIFLKGCRLRCRWCCNPESQEYGIQTMQLQDTPGRSKVVGRDVTVGEILGEIRKDYSYYRRSGGGVTLSGGEALCQPEFAVALLRACQEEGISTAIESSGYADWDVLKEYLPYLDYFLLDIKHMDSRKHEEFTGRPNGLILENARKIAESDANLTIRIPVVPGFNHTKQEIKAIAEYAASLPGGRPGARELHLLPYHRLGQDKYQGLGREYTMAHIEPPANEYMEELLQVVLETGLKGQIGG